MTFTECQKMKGGDNMKRLLSILLCVAICFAFSACTIEDTPKKEVGKETDTAQKKETSFGLNESAVFEKLKFVATEIKETQGTDFFTPEAGNVFVGIKFEIENISSEEQTISTLLLFDGYVDDVKCDYSLSATCAFDEGTLDGDVAAGKKLVGWYALEVPENWQEIELQVHSSWLSNSSAKFVFEK